MAISRKEIGSIQALYLALRDYFRIPEPEIAGLNEQGLSYDELPVVFFIAERSQAETLRVVEMRMAGKTWTDIAFRLGLTPDVFYVPVTAPVPPFPITMPTKATTVSRRGNGRRVSLTEKDVINLVNLRFISDNYGCPPERVIEMRAAGKTFLQINEEIRKAAKE